MTATPLSRAIGANLKRIRTANDLTQSELAKKAGTNINYYAKLERGIAIPSLTMLEKLSRALKVRSSDILPF